MFEISDLLLFTTSAVLLGLAPGPDNIFVLTQSALYGRTAGFIVTLGLCTGLIVHTTLVAVGVAAIFQASALAFSLLKYAGAAYLLYLAWGAFRAGYQNLEMAGSGPTPLPRYYGRGIVMNVTNPKVSIFFLAFLPQFANPENGPLWLQLILLGAIFILVTLIVFGAFSQFAGVVGAWFRRSPPAQRWLNRVAGLVFVGLAVALLTARH